MHAPFLLVFLTVVKQVASSSDNFLVFCANCESESCGVVQNYVKYACKQMKTLKERFLPLVGFMSHSNLRNSQMI